MVASRYVCIDVEPGGSSRYDGAIGLCEIVDGTVGVPFHIGFRSPLHPASEDPDFVDVWMLVAAYLADADVVMAYNASYDRRAVRRLIEHSDYDAHALQVPEIRCLLESARRIIGVSSVGDLGTRVREMRLFTEAEIEVRRRRFFIEGYGSKWLLNDATDDALACARLAVALWEMSGLPPSTFLHPVRTPRSHEH